MWQRSGLREGAVVTMSIREQAYEYICKEINNKRRSLGHAENRDGVTHEELENLQRAIDLLEWISGVVLAAKEE